MISGEKVKHGGLWTVLFSLVSLAWIFPIVLVIINSALLLRWKKR